MKQVLDRTLERILKHSSSKDITITEDLIFANLSDEEQVKVLNQGGFIYVPAFSSFQYATLFKLDDNGIYKLNNNEVVSLNIKGDNNGSGSSNNYVSSILRKGPYVQFSNSVTRLKEKKIEILSEKIQQSAFGIYQAICKDYPLLDKEKRKEVIRTRNRVIASGLV